MQKNKRNSNIESLRILCMFLIVLHHSIYHGVFHDINHMNYVMVKENFLNFTMSNILISGGKVGVATFVLITGYFSVNSKFNILKILPLVRQTFFYSILGLIIGILTNQDISKIMMVKQFLPVIYSQYWFITVYIVMFLLSPFILDLLKNLSGKSEIYLLVILIIINSLLPTFLPKSLEEISNNLLKFIMFFIVGYLLNKYSEKLELNSIKGKKLLISSIILYVLSVLLIQTISILLHFNAFKKAYFLSNLTSPLVLLSVVGIFLIFRDFNMKSNKNINFFSKLMFGVYLFHDNNFVRPLIWNKFFNLENSIDANFFKFFSTVIFSVFAVFLISAIIEFLRSVLFKKIEEKIKKIDFFAYNKINLLFEKTYVYLNNYK